MTELVCFFVLIPAVCGFLMCLYGSRRPSGFKARLFINGRNTQTVFGITPLILVRSCFRTARAAGEFRNCKVEIEKL